jgi:cell division protein FtsZ
MDLTIDEVTTIASIIQDAAGDETEIIFGAVHDPTLEGEVRVTAIATGLVSADEPVRSNIIRPSFSGRSGVTTPAGTASSASGAATSSNAAPRSAPTPEAMPFTRSPERVIMRQQLTDLDIPTFIRRQMD